MVARSLLPFILLVGIGSTAAVAQKASPAKVKAISPPVAGRWYRQTGNGKVDETLQLERKGGAVYTRESHGQRVKSYGSWSRTGTTLRVKLPIKDLRKNDEKGWVLRVESGRLIPTSGKPWIRARARTR